MGYTSIIYVCDYRGRLPNSTPVEGCGKKKTMGFNMFQHVSNMFSDMFQHVFNHPKVVQDFARIHSYPQFISQNSGLVASLRDSVALTCSEQHLKKTVNEQSMNTTRKINQRQWTALEKNEKCNEHLREKRQWTRWSLKPINTFNKFQQNNVNGWQNLTKLGKLSKNQKNTMETIKNQEL